MSTGSSQIVVLTRHFFRDFFYLGFLNDAAVDSFVQLMSSILGGLISLGILIPMMFFRKYTILSVHADAAPYELAVLGDQLLMISVAMFTVGLVGTLVCQSMFPNDIDFRILTPLPITRRTVFGAKLLALAAFTTIFVLATNVATGPVFPAVSHGRWAQEGLQTRIAAHTIASLFASMFALASVLSLQGLIAVLAPRRWIRRASVAAQTATACALMLSLPFIVRASAQGALIDRHDTSWYAIPPAWFLGLEQVLLGRPDNFFLQLSYVGLASLAVCVSCTVVCYVVLYCRFDQTILRRSYAPSHESSEWCARVSRMVNLHPAEAAIIDFLIAGLRRNSLHQLVFLGTCASAMAIAAHSLLTVGIGESFVGNGATVSQSLLLTVHWAPLLVIFVTVRALQDTLRVPLEIRASWIFRMTDDATVRPRQLDAVQRSVFALGVVSVILLFFPVQAFVSGIQRAACWAVLTLLLGQLLVDYTLIGWRTIPFTCAYAPGRRHIIPTVLATLAMFLAFIGLGTVSLLSATTSLRSFFLAAGVLSAAVVSMRWYRLRTWGRTPLEFEEPVDDLQHLGLSSR